jgi:ureidoacrylate peracid hydrolase
MTEVKWDFKKERCALLVIDMQNDFVREGAIMEVPETRNQLPRIATLIDACRALDIPIIYTVHQTDPVFNPLEIATFPHLIDKGMRAGTDGIEVVSELAPLDGEYVLRKRRYSAFYQTDLDIVLRNSKRDPAAGIASDVAPIDTLIICGTVSNICCESTARDAYFRDYKVVFGSDVCSAITKEAHDATLANMELFGRVMKSEDIISALKA